MKTILWAQIMANGFYPHSGPDYKLRSEVWRVFMEDAASAGNVIFGRRTYDEFVEATCGVDLGKIEVVIVTTKAIEAPGITFAASPRAALDYLASKGYETAMIGGGETISSSFLADDLIDEVILVVSPEIGGKGFSVALPEGLRKDLSLLDVREVGEGSVRLHYSVSR